MLARRLLALVLLLAGLAAQAAPLRPQEVPPALEPWRAWALYGEEQRQCPFLYSDATQRRCAWPTALKLDLATDGGSFQQTWRTHTETWIGLPGGGAQWPQDVSVDGAPALVTARQESPAIQVGPGVHTFRGFFAWNDLPEALRLPSDLALVELRINGEDVPFPDIDAAGQLWLSGRERRSPDEVVDALKLSVTRRVIDGIPLELVTRIELEVAGSQREVELGPVSMSGFIPLRLSSPLPARLEDNSVLRVQIRPGHWIIEFAARAPEPVDSLELDAVREPWPAEEVWAFDARNHLRLVEVSGVPAVDPRQTTIPTEWQHLPAYLMRAGDRMRFDTIRRGDPEPEPNELHLNRTLWLDFDGGGYTVHDLITGNITRGWRLETEPELALGQVVLNGEPQLITRRSGTKLEGVEVRRGRIELRADSRYSTGADVVPVGWTQDFRSASATLHLPPGWRLLAAAGIDRASGGWLQRWSLLDLFLVLIAAIAVARLWSWPHGLLALVTLALIWHEPGAPRYVWLHVLAAIALLRVLPEGQFARLVRVYRNLSLVALFLIGLPFLVDQVRLGIYPQLEHPWIDLAQSPVPAQETAGVAPATPSARVLADVESDRMLLERELRASKAAEVAPEPLQMIDPDARVQTGPGLPRWRWTQVNLAWNGPVRSDQSIGLVLLSPSANLALNLLRVALVVALTLLMLGFVYRRGGGLKHASAQIACLAVALPLLLGAPQDARADIPTPELLETFKNRLLAPPECLPACAQIPRMAFDLTPGSLLVRLEVHALEQVAVPLPAQAQAWMPSEVEVDGETAKGLARGATGELLLQLAPGVHQVSMRGLVPRISTLKLPLPLRPHVVIYTAQGWTVEGVHADGQAEPQLQFTRIDRGVTEDQLAPLASRDLPSFVHLERTLRLGLDWHVETRVTRASPLGTPIIIEVPLLEGESVLDEGIRVVKNRVQVNMGPQQQAFAWRSTMTKAPSITLAAPQTLSWTEVWRADVSTIWHLEYAGLPPVHHQSAAGQWLPEWRPWPGEQLRLTITRPEGVEGRVLTIDRASVQAVPGKTATDIMLELGWRSSQGGQHTLMLPEGMQLQSVILDGVAQPIRQEGRKLTLPLAPAAQTAQIRLRSDQGIDANFSTPAIDLAAASVNTELEIRPGESRWILLTSGPRLGPAVLFWGVLLVIAVLAYGLGRTGLTPLKGRHWFLLGLGLTQTPVWVGAVIAGWLLALGLRARMRPDVDNNTFNIVQIALAGLTLLALFMLFEAIRHGLLGLPEMQIAGNGSDAYNLRWYQDRSDATLPQAWILSVPLWVYRVLMLSWALWLALSLLDWLRWGWSSFSTHGLWRQPAPPPANPDAAS